MNGSEPDGTWQRTGTGLFVPVGTDTPAPSGAHGIAADLTPYLIGAVPLLVPVLAFVVVGDPAILRVLLWHANLVALFVAMVPAFLPLAVAAVVFLIALRLAGRGNPRVAAVPALAVAGLLLFFAPIALAIPQLAVIGALLVLLWTRTRRPLRRRLLLAAAAVGGVAAITVAMAGTGLREAVLARTLYGLPREVAVESNGTVWAYYLVATDDRTTTILTGDPLGVRAIRTADIAVRIPCQGVETGVRQSAASVLFRTRSGTPGCLPLADCLSAATPPDTRDDPPTLKRCRTR
jgi:hypothetical protein